MFEFKMFEKPKPNTNVKSWWNQKVKQNLDNRQLSNFSFMNELPWLISGHMGKMRNRTLLREDICFLTSNFSGKMLWMENRVWIRAIHEGDNIPLIKIIFQCFKTGNLDKIWIKIVYDEVVYTSLLWCRLFWKKSKLRF